MQTVSYMGDGSTTEFVFNFPYFENSNIIVTKNNSPATDYSIVGNPAGLDADIPYIGGKVVFETAPSLTDSIIIARQLPLTRSVDYQPTSKLEPTVLNQDMNYTIELLKDLKDELEILRVQYHDIADKESAQILLAKIEAVTNQIRNFEQEIEQGHIMSKDDFYSYTTNCITEIPQDIKLELNNGTITLKAGSKVYIPNSTGKFDIMTISTDKSNSGNTAKAFAVTDGSSLLWSNNVSSGDTAPANPVNGTIWYDTANNLVKRYSTSSSSWVGGFSLPVAYLNPNAESSTTITEMQVFNGFGYIGSTVFALPGVKGLIPNGRNANGSLKNSKVEINSVLRKTLSGNANNKSIVIKNNDIGSADIVYDEVANYNNIAYCIAGKITVVSSTITTLKTKNVFRMVDLNSND